MQRIKTDTVLAPSMWRMFGAAAKFDHDINKVIGKRARQGYELVSVDRRPTHACLVFEKRR